MTYDENKRQINLTTHGIDLALCSCVFDAPMVTKEDDRCRYHEQRLVSLCWFNNRVVVMVWTDRDPVPHVISCRYGDKNETASYFKAVL